MSSSEPLHLNGVLQTVCVLESVILRSFGPEGGHVLFTSDTGQAMLTRDGLRILKSLHLEHPVARMAVECVWKHSAATGDGSKTFILLLASLLRVIKSTTSQEQLVSCVYGSRETAETAHARRLADKLLAFAQRELNHVIVGQLIPYGGTLVWWDDSESKSQAQTQDCNLCVQKLLASFFYTRLSHIHNDFMSDLTWKWIHGWRLKHVCPVLSLQFLNDNFPALYTPVSGFPISSTRLIEGQVIHRDFATPCCLIHQHPVKAVAFVSPLLTKMLDTGDIFQVGGGGVTEEGSIVHYSAWMERSLECVIANLQTLGVSVILSAVKQPPALLSLAAQARVCVVECVSEDELSLFAHLSGALPVSDYWKIEQEHVATLSFCRPVQLGASRYVHLAFHGWKEDVPIRPCSVVICAPGEGQTDQHANSVRDAVRMLLTASSNRSVQSHSSTSVHVDSVTQDASFSPQDLKTGLAPGWVVPAGGVFELILSHALLHPRPNRPHTDATMADHIIPRLLAKAILAVPHQIYSPQGFLQTQTRVMSFVLKHSHTLNLALQQEHSTIYKENQASRGDHKPSLHCCKTRNLSAKDFVSDSGLESVSCKYELLLAVLQCLSSLLRVDAVLRTRTALHTQKGPSSASRDDTQDEAED